MTEAEIALIVQEARYGTDCPVSGDFNAAVRDAIQAGYRAGLEGAAVIVDELAKTCDRDTSTGITELMTCRAAAIRIRNAKFESK